MAHYVLLRNDPRSVYDERDLLILDDVVAPATAGRVHLVDGEPVAW
jgi:hypothetical protein